MAFCPECHEGLWHIRRAAGGSTPGIRTVLTTTPDMQATSSSGTWTRFSIEANADIPGTYLLTVPLANTVNQRLRLLGNGTTDFSTNNNTGINPSFVFTEAAAAAAEIPVPVEMSCTVEVINNVPVVSYSDFPNVPTVNLSLIHI